ncbi:MAG: carboxypeptidase regulatory-like domain-containing protein [Anaerolineales bacterium]
MKTILRFSMFIVAFLLNGCGASSSFNAPPAGPSPIPVSSPTPLPAAQVVFNLTPPDGTPADAKIDLVILDEVTGIDLNSQSFPMTFLDEGHWQATLLPPVGSLLRYRYVLREPDEIIEGNIAGSPTRYRVAHFPGHAEIHDIVPVWSGQEYAGTAGRIMGQLTESDSGNPLEEIIVQAGGKITFTDSDGQFRLDQLPPGLHTLTAFSPDGSVGVVAQEVQIAPDQTTPVIMDLPKALPVTVTFEVTVPADTIPGTPLRLAGNVVQFGNRFVALKGNIDLSIEHMPELIMVDALHYIAVLELYEGTDLRYKYTQGDGLWNAERDEDGFFRTRHVILPDEDITIRDTIASWHVGDRGSLAFHVKAPDHTPPLDDVTLQINPSTWYEPIPMWKIGTNEWFYIINSPLDFTGKVEYRYCRNSQCGSADDIDTFGPNAPGRPLTISEDQGGVVDEIEDWQWYGSEAPSTPIISDVIIARPDFEAGIELSTRFHPSMDSTIPEALEDIYNLGANSVTHSPAWVLEGQNPIPIISFDPALAPFEGELESWIEAAQQNNSMIVIRPSLLPSSGSLADWWSGAVRDRTWWTVWFDEYKSFMLSYADLASKVNADKLIIGGVEISPAFPSGKLADGTSSGVLNSSEEHWRDLIDEIRKRYLGQIALELDPALDELPPFIDMVDEVVLYWHEPLSEDPEASAAELQAAANARLDEVLFQIYLDDMPITLSVDYPSVQGSIIACPPAPDGSCRPTAEFDAGAVVDPDLEVDFSGQAKAINALLLAAFPKERITGFSVRGYYPAAALRDKSSSIHGKPAQDVLWYWYPRMVGDSDQTP